MHTSDDAFVNVGHDAGKTGARKRANGHHHNAEAAGGGARPDPAPSPTDTSTSCLTEEQLEAAIKQLPTWIEQLGGIRSLFLGEKARGAAVQPGCGLAPPTAVRACAWRSASACCREHATSGRAPGMCSSAAAACAALSSSARQRRFAARANKGCQL
jgi:hypothetical protein